MENGNFDEKIDKKGSEECIYYLLFGLWDNMAFSHE